MTPPAIARASDFLRHDIWRVRVRDLPRPKSFVFRFLRVVTLAVRGFAEDKCQLRASALTFYSLLSIVPVLAMAFGIAKGFGLDRRLEVLIAERMQAQEEVVTWLMEFARSLLVNTSGGLVAGAGVLFLFWTVVQLLGNIESSFNDIWGIKQGRSWNRRLSDYLAVMTICPVLLIVSSSLTVFLSTQLRTIMDPGILAGAITPMASTVIHMLPYLVVWALFAFLYIFLPNTKVSWSAGLLASLVAGTLYQLVQWAYVSFQVGVANYNAVYGSFAALPLFLIWLRTSWLVMLFGAEISFAVDNEERYEFEGESLSASPRLKRLLALRIAELCVKRFVRGDPPLSAMAIARQIDTPIRLVRELLYALVQAKVLVPVRVDDHDDEHPQPARDVEQLTVKQVIDMLDRRGHEAGPVVADHQLDKLQAVLDQMDRDVLDSPANLKLKDL